MLSFINQKWSSHQTESTEQRVTELKLIQFRDKMTKKLEAVNWEDMFFLNKTKEWHLWKPENAKEKVNTDILLIHHSQTKTEQNLKLYKKTMAQNIFKKNIYIACFWTWMRYKKKKIWYNVWILSSIEITLD